MQEKAKKVFKRIIISVTVLLGLFLAVVVFDAVLVDKSELTVGWHEIWELHVWRYGDQATAKIGVAFVCAEGQMFGLVPRKVKVAPEIRPGHEKIFVYRDPSGAVCFNLIVNPDWPDLKLVPKSQL